MPLPTETANTIGEFLDLSSAHDPDHHRMWFRGQSDASWSLVPGMLRSDTVGSGPVPQGAVPVVIENGMRAQFMNRVAQYDVHRASTVLEELAIMQHYGFPTRLLDWSEASLVGLYWAIKDDRPSDAMVFGLVPERICDRVSHGLAPGVAEVLAASLDASIDPKPRSTGFLDI